MNWPTQTPSAGRHTQFSLLVRATLLLAPAGVLAIDASRHQGSAQSISLGVAVTLAVEGLYLIIRYGPQRATNDLFPIGFYAVAAAVLRFNSPNLSSSYLHTMLAATMLVPVGLFVRREVAAAGGKARRVKFLIGRLLGRREWPANFAEYRSCPLIQSLRDGIRDDAAPILPLLAHDDVRIQMAALTALEFHIGWRKGQVESVLQRAIYTDQPAVRAAALLALANVVKTRHVNSLLPFLIDAAQEVRQSAAIALLWDAPNRWTEIRGNIRAALAAPHAAKDGPLPCSGSLPPIALDDLVNWAVESGSVGKRATLTLVRHCKKAIHEDGSPQAIGRVTNLVANPRVPAAIRVELAHRLQSADAFPIDVASRLLGPANPMMLRVLAAGAVLHNAIDATAIDVLREAARQPNREISLASAGLAQRYLGVDLGLAVGGQLPATNSREAAEIARRVEKWANEPDSQNSAETPADAAVAASDVAYF